MARRSDSDSNMCNMKPTLHNNHIFNSKKSTNQNSNNNSHIFSVVMVGPGVQTGTSPNVGLFVGLFVTSNLKPLGEWLGLDVEDVGELVGGLVDGDVLVI